MRAAVLLAVAACNSSATTGSTPSTGTTTTTPVPAVAADAAGRSPIPAETQIMLTGVIDDWSSTTATLQLWFRTADSWQELGPTWPAVIGSAGAAWGDGLHGEGAPAGRQGPRKHEGDLKSPAGVFAIRGAYGYAATPPDGTKLPYIATDDQWQCVDDPASSHYAEILDRRRTTTIDWHSAEQMRRRDALYTWVVDVAHNPQRTAGDGSCIFLHVWDGPDSTTVGCTAMAAKPLVAVLAMLDPQKAPLYVLLPRAEYRALEVPWGLPLLHSPATLQP